MIDAYPALPLASTGHLVSRPLLWVGVLLIGLGGGATPTPIHAAIVNPNLIITASSNFDSVNSFADSPFQVTGSNAADSPITETGQGIRFTSQIGGSFDTTSSEFLQAIDFGVTVQNTSAAVAFEVTFAVDFNNTVTSSGTDAFAGSELTIDDASGEIFFSEVISDTLNGNERGGILTGGFGSSVEEAGVFVVDFLLDPLSTMDITGQWTGEGGMFDTGSTAALDLSATITVVDTAPIPLPGTLGLLASTFVFLKLARRRR